MIALASRIHRVLRSRKLAIWLILALCVYAMLATLVPKTTASDADRAKWRAEHPRVAPIVSAVGFDRPYSSPLFLLLAAWVTASTLVCSWERTGVSLRAARSAGTVTDATLSRLRHRPDVTIAATDTDPLAHAADALGSLRLRVRRGPTAVFAEGGRLGLFGSPLFHWSLALLCIVIAGGQLTRSEGKMGVPVGGERIEAAESYGRLDTGPLFLGHTGLGVRASDLVTDFRDAGGVARGPAPVVSLYEGERLVAERRVYPNSPLRHGRLLIHMDDFGFAPQVSLEDSAGANLGRSEMFADLDPAIPTRTQPFSLQLTQGEREIPVRGWVERDTDGTDELEGLRIHLEVGERGELGARTLKLGEAMDVPGGRIRYTDMTHYVRLSVANDWSIYPIYLLFVLASIGVSLSVFFPPRTVWVMLVGDGAEARLHVVMRHRRGDPNFPERVEETLRSALEAPAPSVRRAG